MEPHEYRVYACMSDDYHYGSARETHSTYDEAVKAAEKYMNYDLVQVRCCVGHTQIFRYTKQIK